MRMYIVMHACAHAHLLVVDEGLRLRLEELLLDEVDLLFEQRRLGLDVPQLCGGTR
jgi:hypothetical protein